MGREQGKNFLKTRHIATTLPIIYTSKVAVHRRAMTANVTTAPMGRRPSMKTRSFGLYNSYSVMFKRTVREDSL